MAIQFLALKREPGDKVLFVLDDDALWALDPIFIQYSYRTGLHIDEYGTTRLTVENAQTLIAVIDKYVAETDLNAEKERTSGILEFKGLLRYFIRHGIDLVGYGE